MRPDLAPFGAGPQCAQDRLERGGTGDPRQIDGDDELGGGPTVVERVDDELRRPLLLFPSEFLGCGELHIYAAGGGVEVERLPELQGEGGEGDHVGGGRGAGERPADVGLGEGTGGSRPAVMKKGQHRRRGGRETTDERHGRLLGDGERRDRIGGRCGHTSSVAHPAAQRNAASFLDSSRNAPQRCRSGTGLRESSRATALVRRFLWVNIFDMLRSLGARSFRGSNLPSNCLSVTGTSSPAVRQEPLGQRRHSDGLGVRGENPSNFGACAEIGHIAADRHGSDSTCSPASFCISVSIFSEHAVCGIITRTKHVYRVSSPEQSRADSNRQERPQRPQSRGPSHLQEP
jgi:hypothetical protein